MDFLDSLKTIKKDMEKQQKQSEPKKAKKINPNRDEFKEIWGNDDEISIEKESISHRQKRLQDEFLQYTKHANIRKI